jgi:superfamily II DNA or RNA helicase
VSEVELTDAFFQKSAGWEAVQHARALLAAGNVLSSNWTPPLLKGVVAAGDTSYRAGLVIKGPIDIENICSCRQARELGTLCPHSVAVGLHHLKGSAPTAVDPRRPPDRRAAVTPTRTTGTIDDREPARLRRAEQGEPLEIHVLFPPNLSEAAARGRVMLVFEGATSRGRLPLSSLIKSGPFTLSTEDSRLLDAAELALSGNTPGATQLPTKDFLALLPALSGHPRLTVGRKHSLSVSPLPAPLPLRAEVQPDGEIKLSLKPGKKRPAVLGEGEVAWALTVDETSASIISPLALSPAFREALQRPMRIARAQVPTLLCRDWPQLAALGSVEANFQLSDFELTPQPPRFILNLAGGLAQLTGILQCAYGPRIMTVGVTARDEATWLPDPANPRRYSTRDLAAEHEAFMRLRRAGFGGPDSQGQWKLLGQDRVISFFAREFPRLEREWQVTLEERLERSTKNNLERIKPQFRVTPSGEQWFDLEISYAAGSGERFTAADIQALLHGGGSRRLKSGRFAILDTGAVEELQEVILDCAPQQRPGAQGANYRMNAQQAGFLDATLREQGFPVSAPAGWRERAQQQRGELKLGCPPLGPLDAVLRPYQKHGVAWLRFLRDNGFGGVLADEMGLGKTLQVLAHLRVGLAPSPRGASTDLPLAPETGCNSGRLEARPTLVICPTSLVFNWAAEAAKFTPELRVLTLSGPERHADFDRISDHHLVITSYALIRRDLARYREFEFDTVVLDEAQHIKNRQTQNAQAVKAIRSAHRLVLTGTPLENSVLDLWSIFDFLMPGYLGSADDFRERYEVPITREQDAASMNRLGRRVRPFLLRRLKRDVAPELPAKLEQISFCELTDEQASVYQQLLSQTRKEVSEAVGDQGLAKSRMLVLTALLRLRQVCCDLRLLQLGQASELADAGSTQIASSDAADAGDANSRADSPTTLKAILPLSGGEGRGEGSGKLQLFSELLDEIVDGGHRVLVFSQFTSMLALLREELAARELAFCYLDGSTTNRAEVVQRFQTDSSIPAFLVSLKAGGVGLNLTGADTVIHFDPWWNPAVEDQATDRAHRIGQTRVVTSYKLIARGTVEEKILSLQRRKRDLIEATLTGEEAFTSKLSWEEIQELLS